MVDLIYEARTLQFSRSKARKHRLVLANHADDDNLETFEQFVE